MDLTVKSLAELKTIGWDMRKQHDNLTRNLQIVQNEIEKREMDAKAVEKNIKEQGVSVEKKGEEKK